MMIFFFFQAEDGIRDLTVTGVQTCALPISLLALAPAGKVPRMEMIRMDGWVLAYTFGISVITGIVFGLAPAFQATRRDARESLSQAGRDRKSTRLNSSHSQISYAVFCLKKKT